MAIYDGFFDAVQDEDTEEYDREYSSGDFTEYFNQFIGSGVCIHNNPDSFKVRLEGGKAIIGPGYLFIQGYWLKNDADYAVTLPASDTAAIAAHLNLGKRMIEIEVRSIAQSYPDSLVLALVDVSTGTVEDTRHNAEICGVIDSSGGLSKKIEYATSYIDKEIGTKLEQIEKDIAAQEKRLDKKIKEVQAVADSIVPPPIGSIKFSAAENVGPEWLKCDGAYINQSDYPELVELLRKPPVGPENLQSLPQIYAQQYVSSSFIYDGYLWIFSTYEPMLYGLSLNGGPTKEIPCTFQENVTWVAMMLTLSLVETDRVQTLYLIPEDSFTNSMYDWDTKKSTYWIEAKYYYFRGFDPNISEISFQTGVVKTDSIVANDQFKYFLSDSNIRIPYRPVIAVNSKPYVALGHVLIADRGNDTVTSASFVLATLYLVVAALIGTEGEVAYYPAYACRNSRTGKLDRNLFDIPAYIYPPVYFNEHDGGCVYLKADTSPRYEIIRIEGETTVSLGKTNGEYPDNRPDYLTNGNRQVVTGIYGITDEFSVRFVNLDSMENTKIARKISGFSNSETSFFGSMDGPDFIYIEENDLWAFFENGFIIFAPSPLENGYPYWAVNVRDILTNPSPYGQQNTCMGYDNKSHCLFITGRSADYKIKSVILKLEPGYDYINGAKLPNLSMNNIPAYIKAKEVEK